MSGGERQMLAMGMALLRKPRVMLFDEPTGNLSPKLTTQVLNKVTELKDKLGIVIILVEQSARRALEVGQKCYLMVSGKPIFEGEPRDLLSHPEFGKLYLGIKV
jgi:branched-chain amino acid transport system ATP-binding protein